MKNKSLGKRIVSFIPAVFSLILCVGIKLIFPACDPMEDGSFMKCHWAEQAVFAVSISLSVMSVMTAAVRDPKIRAGVSLAMITAAISAAVIPDTLIGLCMKTDMRCHALMKPAVIILAVLIAVSAAVNFIANIKEEQK